MKSIWTFCFAVLFFSFDSFAQQDSADQAFANIEMLMKLRPQQKEILPPGQSPYVTRFKVDAPIIAAGIGLNLLGYSLIMDKKDLTPEQLASKKIENIPFFDRSNAGWYSEKWDKISYYPFQASFAIPVVVALLNKNERNNLGQVTTLYLETMAIVGGIYTMSAGVFDRPRPFVYGTEASYADRISGNNQRSFMAGHTASTTAALIFTAKVFSDMNPDSKLKPYIWTTAIATSAFMGYMRYRAGMHFISDNVAGFLTGFAVGYFVPHLHKSKRFKEKISIIPYAGPNTGIAVLYKF